MNSVLFKIRKLERKLSSEQWFRVDRLDIPRGGMIAVVGRSGSGKSTFLSYLAGLARTEKGSFLSYLAGLVRGEKNTHDSVVIDLLDPNYQRLAVDRNAARLRSGPIGYIFQSNDLLKPSPVSSNVALAAAFSDKPVDREIVAAGMAGLNIAPLAQLSNAATLSGGELQRVAYLRALVRSPELIIADEPTASLDPKTADSMFDRLREWCDERPQNTVIWVTHKIDEVAKHADGIVVFSDCQSLNPGYCAENPGDEATIRLWMEGESLDQMTMVGALNPGSDHEDSGESVSGSGEQIPVPTSSKKQSTIREQISTVWKLSFNFVFSNYSSESDRQSETFHRIRNQLPKSTVTQIMRNSGVGIAPQRNAFSRIWNFFGQLGRSFGQISALSAIMIFFTGLLCLVAFWQELQERNEEILNDPSLSNIVIRGRPDIFAFDEKGMGDLKCLLKMGDRYCEDASDVRAYGRWATPERDVRIPKPALETDEGGFLPQEISEICADNLQRSTRTRANVLSVDRREPGLQRLPYLDNSALKSTTDALRTGPVDWVRGDLDRVVVTRQLFSKLKENGLSESASPVICLKLREWRLAEIMAVVSELALDVADQHDLLLENEVYALAALPENADIGLQRFEKVAFYIDPQKADRTIAHVEPVIVNTAGLVLERGFEKFRKAIENANFYNAMSVLGIMLAALAMVCTILLISSGLIMSNQRAFLVSRAFGMKLWHLLLYLLVVFAIVSSFAIASVLIICILAIFLIDTLTLEVPAYLQTLTHLNLSSVGIATLILLIVLVLSVAISGSVWWYRNRNVWAKLQETT